MSDEDEQPVDNEDAALHPEATVEAPDPTRDLPSPSVEVPDPSAELDDEPEDTETPTVDVPQDLWLSFWYLVVVFNAAVLALGVGLLLVTLGNDPDLGGRLLLAGGALSVYGYYRYRTNPYSDGLDAESGA